MSFLPIYYSIVTFMQFFEVKCDSHLTRNNFLTEELPLDVILNTIINCIIQKNKKIAYIAFINNKTIDIIDDHSR